MAINISHDHMGITVTPENLDPTIDWYTGNLGFKVEQRFEAHGTTFVYIVSGDAKIELLAGASEHQAHTEDVLGSMGQERLHHICFAVEDLDAAVADLQARNVVLIGGPMEVAEIAQRIAFVADNLGNIIELADPGTWPVHRGN